MGVWKRILEQANSRNPTAMRLVKEQRRRKNMSTINKELAEKLAKDEGRYHGDPQALAVFKYWNSFFNKEDYAVIYNHKEWERYLDTHEVLDILWSRKDFDHLRGCTTFEENEC